jgi:HemY protein
MTFWRWLFYLVQVGVVAALALWVAARPGHVSFVWLGHRVDTSMGVLLAALLLVIGAAILLHRIWRLVWRGPRDLARLNAERKRQQGYRALSQGMAAVAAGDAGEARRQAKIANAMLKDPPLTLLLAAQTAQLGGDEDAARRYFTAMLERPETAFLGIRGLLTQALKAGDRAEALLLARRAYEERPNTPWAIATLLDLQLESGDWKRAQPLLQHAAKLKVLADPIVRRRRAVIAAERARREPPATGLDAAREAVKLAPDLVPARAMLARLLAQAGRARDANRMLEQGWVSAPHPELAAAYAAIVPEEEPIARYRRFERLNELSPRHRESLLALGECALAADLWSEARKNLGFVAAGEGDRPSGRLARLMARLEEGPQGDSAAARRWLIAASNADPDPGWQCQRCGTLAQGWRANCPHCHAFDSLVWQAPLRQAAHIGIAGLAGMALPAPVHPAGGNIGAASAPGPTIEGKAEPLPPPVDAARLVN